MITAHVHSMVIATGIPLVQTMRAPVTLMINVEITLLLMITNHVIITFMQIIITNAAVMFLLQIITVATTKTLATEMEEGLMVVNVLRIQAIVCKH